MQPIDQGMDEHIQQLKSEGKEFTFKCANCGAWQGQEHKEECPEPKPVPVEINQ